MNKSPKIASNGPDNVSCCLGSYIMMLKQFEARKFATYLVFFTISFHNISHAFRLDESPQLAVQLSDVKRIRGLYDHVTVINNAWLAEFWQNFCRPRLE